MTTTRRFRIHWGSPVLLLPLALLLLAELSLRSPTVENHLPEPDPYYDIGVETRLQVLDTLLARRHHVDVLFVGSSVVRTNIQPLRFDSLMRSRTGVRLVSFNGGMSALVPDPVRLYLQHFWFPHVHPDLIVQAVRYEEMHSDVTAENWYRFKSGHLEKRWISHGLLSGTVAQLIGHTRLLYYQGTVTEWLVSGWSPADRVHDFPVDRRGYGATELTLRQAVARGRLDGSPPVYDSPYGPEDFATGLAALRRSVRLAHSQGADYVLVNMPEQCGRFLDAPDGRERYQGYLRVLRAFAAAEHIRFIDVTHGDPATWCDERWFSDYHHMSPLGAARFTTQLARAFVSDTGRRGSSLGPAGARVSFAGHR